MSADQSPETVVEKAKPKAVTVVWREFVTKNIPAIEAAMPRIGITGEAVARTALSQMYRNPKLMQCDKTSVIRAIVEAASLGLTFALGRAYLVPFNNRVKNPDGGPDTWRVEAQLIPGYQGLVDLVRRGAGVKSVLAGAVYEGDQFVYAAGLQEDTFQHVSIVEPEDAKLTHTYCIIRFLDGGYQWIVLTRKQIDAVRARSKSGDSGPWKTDYAAMAIKTAVKRCTKLCPASIELVRALDLDNRAERGEEQELAADIDFGSEGAEAPTEPKKSVERVKERLKKDAKAATGPAASREPAPDDEAAKGELPPEEESQEHVETPAERISFALLDLAGGSQTRADVCLSEATGGKLQKVADLAKILAEKPGYIEIIDAYIDRKTKGGGGE